jgi:hypothetical protein
MHVHLRSSFAIGHLAQWPLPHFAANMQLLLVKGAQPG